MGARCRQHVAIEHKGIPGNDGDGSTITVRLLLSAKVVLRDAAEVLACPLVIEVRERQCLSRLALERNGLAIHHAEPLVRKLNLGGRARGRGGMVGDILPRLGSDREHDRISLVGAHVLRLRDHTRHVRLRELKRNLLRRGDIAQRDLVHPALVIRNVEVDGLVRADLRNRHALEIATLVRRRRKGRIPAFNNRNRSIVDRTVNRLRRHLVALGLLLDRQRSGIDRDIEVRVGDCRVDPVLTRRRFLIRRAEVCNLYVRGIATTHQAGGKLGIRLALKALGIVDLHQQLSRSNSNRKLNILGGKVVSRRLGMGDNTCRTGSLHGRATSLDRNRAGIVACGVNELKAHRRLGDVVEHNGIAVINTRIARRARNDLAGLCNRELSGLLALIVGVSHLNRDAIAPAVARLQRRRAIGRSIDAAIRDGISGRIKAGNHNRRTVSYAIVCHVGRLDRNIDRSLLDDKITACVTHISVGVERRYRTICAGIHRCLIRRVMRIARAHIRYRDIALAALRHARKLRSLRRRVVDKALALKCKRGFLRLHDQREVCNTLVAQVIGAPNLEAAHTRSRRHTRKHQGARTVIGLRQLHALGNLNLIQVVRIRRLAAPGAGNHDTVVIVSGRRRQHAPVEHECLAWHDGHRRMLGIRLCHRAQVALRNAAEVLALVVTAELGNREGLPRLALQRHRLAAIGRHAIPLVAQLNVGGRTRRYGGMDANITPRLGSNRKLNRIAIVSTRILRLSEHLRSRSLREFERDLLRSTHAAQRDLVRPTLIVRNIKVIGIAGRTVLASLFGNGHARQVAALIGHRRKRHLAIRSDRSSLRIDRSVDRSGRHLVLRCLHKARLDGHVVLGNKRPNCIRAQRLIAQRPVVIARIPPIEHVARIGNGSQRRRLTVLDLIGYGIPQRFVLGGTLDVSALTRIHRRDRHRRPLINGRKGTVAKHHAVDYRRGPHGQAVLVNPVFKLPALMRHGKHNRRGVVGAAGTKRNHAKARALGIRSDLNIAARLIEHSRELPILLGGADIERAIAHRDARIVDPVREVVLLPRNRDRHKHVAPVVRPATGRNAVDQKGRAAEDGRARNCDGHLSIGFKLRVVRHILRGGHIEGRRGLDNRGTLLVGAPAHKAIAHAGHSGQLHLIACGKAATARNTAAPARSLVLHHDLARNGHLVRIGKHGLELQRIVLEPLNHILVELNPAMGVTTQQRLVALGVQNIPADKTLGPHGRSVEFDRITELIGALAAQGANAIVTRAQNDLIGLRRKGRRVGSVARNLNGIVGVLADCLAPAVRPARKRIPSVGDRAKRRTVAGLIAAKAAHSSTLGRRSDRAHNIRARCKHGVERRILAHGKSIGFLGAHTRSVTEPAHKSRILGGDCTHGDNLPGGICPRALDRTQALFARDVNRILLCREHGLERRVRRRHHVIGAITAYHGTRGIGPILKRIARKRMRGQRGGMPRLDGTRALDPAGGTRFDQRTGAGIDYRRGFDFIAFCHKASDVHMAALLMAGELRIVRLKRAVGRIPTSKDVTGIGRRLKGNLRTAVCKDAARLDGATLCRIGEGHADGIDGHKGRGNNTAPGFTASFGNQRGLVLKALQAPVDIPAPEQKAWMGLGRQMKGLP